MGSPIDRTNKSALDLNLVNGVTSDAPKIKANNDTLYDYADGLNQQLGEHQSSVTLPHADGSVTEVKLADSSVGTSKLKNGSVTETKLADGSVGSAKLKDGNVTEGKLADDAVTTSKLKDRNVTRQKIATGAVGANELDPALLSGTSAGIVQGNLDNHITDYIKHPGFAGTTGGTSTAYTASLSPAISLTAGEGIVFVAHNNSGANPTLNVNGKGAKPIKKPNGNAAVLVSGGLYTARYDGTNFILQGEGGSGDATASDLLAGKKASVDAGDIVGTMPDRSTGTYAASAFNMSGTTLELSIPVTAKYGAGAKITRNEPNKIPGNIRDGVSIDGVTGNMKAEVSAGTNQLFDGNTLRSTTSTTPVKVKEAVVDWNGKIRVSCAIRTTTALETICGRVYKNGSPFGQLFQAVNKFDIDQSWTEDLTVADGDVLSLYIWIPTSTGASVIATMFKFSIAEKTTFARLTVN